MDSCAVVLGRDHTMDSEAIEERAESAVEEIYEQLEVDPVAGLELARAIDGELARHPAVQLALAHALVAVDDENSARPLLESLVAHHPDHADARHLLALVCGAQGDRSAMVEQFLQVAELDAREDAVLGFDLPGISRAIVELVEDIILELPEEFRERMSLVPVVVEARPALDLVRAGFDPRSVGMFEGDDAADRQGGGAGLPPRIVLYAANLTASLDEDDPEELEREVETTLLHEIGHYLGLDEEQLEELGLG
jgi:predicted Zn-dependent protease with MMP-like domain